MTWLLDCDGVIWLQDEALPGAVEAVCELRAGGTRVVMLTNNSFHRHSDYLAKLARLGMPTEREDLLSSAMAAALLVEKGERALVLGGPGLIEELQARGVDVVLAADRGDPGPVDAVVVGLDPSFDYKMLAVAAKSLHGGARLIGSNEDATFPTADGALPGAGALLVAVACAGQATPVVAGKPHAPTVGLIKERIGDVEMVVGDRPSTDGVLARRLGTRFGLVLTGVTPPGHGPVDPEPDLESPDLASLVAATCR